MLPYFELETIDIRVFQISNFHFPQHLQKSLEIVYCESGKASLLIDNKVYSINKGEVAIIFPNTVHSYLSVDEENQQEFSAIILISSLKYCGSYAKSLAGFQPSNPILTAELIHKDISFCIYGLYNEIRATKYASYSHTCCHAYMELLLSRIMPELALNKTILSDQSDLTVRLMSYVQDHFQEPMSLDSLAKKLNVSKYYLSHTFSNKLHTTFPNYINEFRLNHALSMIHLGSNNITEIWTESGFESQRTFNRFFRSQIGLTPTNYIRLRK